MSDKLRDIEAATIDERAQNPRYRQNELKKLHEALVESKSSILGALRNDSEYSLTEAETEYYLTVQCIREQYNAIDIVKAHDEEYSLANGKNQPSRLVPVGCVYISPSTHSILYSTVAPLSVAIAAGNCVVIELKQTLSELTSLLRRLLSTALDGDTFLVVDSKPANDNFLTRRCVHVRTSDDSTSESASTSLISSTSSRTVAIVDRSSNIKDAAREITRARFSFRGQSPYAPDIVLLNEFALEEFCNAAVQEATKYFAGSVKGHANGSVDGSTNESASHSRRKRGNAVKDLPEEDASILVSGSRGAIALVKKRNSQWLTKKISEPLLLVHAFSSLDDAIDLTNSRTDSPLLAAYLFAAPPAAKYLSQFLNTLISLTNKIPTVLLVGPATPKGFTPSPSTRFTREMFSRPRPEYITFPPLSTLLAQVLDGDSGVALKTMRDESTASLPPTKQPDGKAIGFFDQGLITGALIALTSTVGTLGVVGYYAVPAVLKRLR